MSGEELLHASEKSDLDEVNRLLLEGAEVKYKNRVWHKYFIICIITIYCRMDIQH
jgi:hypothetical protein